MLSFELPPLRVTLTSAHHLDKVNSGLRFQNNLSRGYEDMEQT